MAETTVHDLKIWPAFFSPLLSGHKAFEVRKNDRDFKCGDLLMLHEWDPETKAYTGRWQARRVTYVIHRHEGLAEGYVAMGLGPA